MAFELHDRMPGWMHDDELLDELLWWDTLNFPFAFPEETVEWGEDDGLFSPAQIRALHRYRVLCNNRVKRHRNRTGEAERGPRGDGGAERRERMEQEIFLSSLAEAETEREPAPAMITGSGRRGTTFDPYSSKPQIHYDENGEVLAAHAGDDRGHRSGRRRRAGALPGRY